VSGILTTLKEAVDGTGTLPVAAKTDKLDAEAPAASIQQLPGARMAVTWVDGGGISEQPFAVSLRTSGGDTKKRVDAWSALVALASALEAIVWDEESGIKSVYGVDTPALVERDGHGGEVWRATFMLESVR